MARREVWVFGFLGIVTFLYTEALGQTECKIPPFITTTVSPNVLIVFDTSGSMWNVVWDSHFNPRLEYHEVDRNGEPNRLLPVSGNQVVFARENLSCQPSPHQVLRDSKTGRVRLRYERVRPGSTDICTSVSGVVWSDSSGYFYFDRSKKRFIEAGEYDGTDPNHVKVFLPYAPYSETSDPMAQETWYDYNYLNWIFYRSTVQERESIIREAGFGSLIGESDAPVNRSRLTRILATKEVIKDVVQRVEGIRFGVMRFRGDSGGELIAPIGRPVDEIVRAVDEQWAGGWTPLAETMEDVWEYFAGENSPIEHWCQKNFVILVTDGLPTKDADDLSSRMKRNWDLDGGGGLGDSEENVYPNQGSDYLDDIAYYMYEHDARPDLRRGNEKRNIVTYTIGFSIANKLLVDTAFNGNGLHGREREWLDPESPLYHKYFYMAESREELAQAIGEAMREISMAASSGTGVAVSSGTTRTDDLIFRASFHPQGWKGYLEAIEVGDDPDSLGPVRWEAGARLKNLAPEEREIYTALKSATGMDEKVDFTERNATRKDAENRRLLDLLDAGSAEEGGKIIRFIRGGEVEGFRDRGGTKLGDIIHSTPVVVGAPNGYFNDSKYLRFRQEYGWRPRMVYVGANDGMLHAFSVDGAEAGREAWAFIPNNLLGKLKNLTSPDYVDCHEYFVDLKPTVADVFIDPDGAGPEERQWRTLLIGGERGGGRAYFALDITDPRSDRFRPLWEFSDLHLGESWSLPAVGKVRLGEEERWIAFLGSGFDNDDGRAYLFALDLEKGENFIKPLSLGADSPNVLASPRSVDINGDDYVDSLLAGDLRGRFWRIDVTDQAGDPKTYRSLDPKDWEPREIFEAPPEQPIMFPPGLSFYCSSSTDRICQNLFIYFGTGKYLTTDDKTDNSPQSFYAIKDEYARDRPLTREDLADRTNGADEEVPNPSKIKGWFVDLEAPGERVSSSPLVIGGLVFFLTFVPDEDPCSAGGTTWLYYREFDTGRIPRERVLGRDEGEEEGPPVGKILIGQGYAQALVYYARTQDMLIQTSNRRIHRRRVILPAGAIENYAWREVFY